MAQRKLIFFGFILGLSFFTARAQSSVWEYRERDYNLTWDLDTDKARVAAMAKSATIWEGSLLPSFWLANRNHEMHYVHARFDKNKSIVREDRLELNLVFEGFGTGRLVVQKKEWGLQFERLTVSWNSYIPAIVEMYFGTRASDSNSYVHPLSDKPFKPDWQSAGYCVPGAKEGTVQSYFRNWDFGQTEIALGNYGPSLGTPYGAAFPRPFLFTGMGSNDGWVALGAGAIPDAAMMVRIQSTHGCFKYLYREDLWGASANHERTWEEPLRITMDKTAPDAFAKYFSSFPAKKSFIQPKPLWNTWGMWRLRKFPMKPLADFADKIKAGVFVLDDSWESSQGSGKPNLQRFPDFEKDIQYVRSKKMDIGAWETLGWISDTLPYGFASQDLIVDRRGRPCKTNWNFDDAGESYYCLDISSEKVKTFLRERTLSMMKTLMPMVIKLDFGYAMPDPNIGVPRDPAYRGERYSYELMEIIAGAAKSVNPSVTIMYYGISPLWSPVVDLVSLDDQGDLWYELHRGHQEWSIWASLLSKQGVAITGSSSYNWNDDAEVLLNSAILGLPGASLALTLDQDKPIPESYINRRFALNKWCRRTLIWEPAWFNSIKGDLDGPPRLNCWGRLEPVGDKKLLTALALREAGKETIDDESLKGARWTGDWCLIAQDDQYVFSSYQLAIIPFTAGSISIPLAKRPLNIIRENSSGQFIFTNWKWEQGELSFQVSQSLFEHTSGFLIESK